MQIQVKPEGRENIYLPEKESLKDWITSKRFKQIHNFIPSTFGVIGADHETKSVLEDIDQAERIAILTGSAQRNNMRHALSIIKNNKMQMYDIGEITEQDLEIINQ